MNRIGGKIIVMPTLAAMTAAIAHELVLFAAILFLIGGIDDLVVDIIWIVRTLWRRATVYRRHQRATLASLPAPRSPGRLAVFIPAWHEDEVIGRMIQTALDRFDHDDYALYVGCYPNDSATWEIVAGIAKRDDRVKLVVNMREGPTTKADCLNTLWRALLSDEIAEGWRAKAVILHDAEDIVHSGELRVFDTLIERFALVQLPVLPLIDRGSRWISGHYCDEFAETHGKALVAREAIGAAMPSAGVGCAFARSALGGIAALKGGSPFDADSLTEDYELGLRITELGGRGIFVRLATRSKGGLVAVRAHFPATLADAVHQKSRWMTGIALAGWDRLGWQGGPAEFWMRLRDRRALLAAIVLSAAYAGLCLTALAWILAWLTGVPVAPSPGLGILLLANSVLLVWRLGLRFAFVARDYGWREGLRAIPRVFVANIIAMMAARRAIGRYLAIRRNEAPVWGKTRHFFPETAPVE